MEEKYLTVVEIAEHVGLKFGRVYECTRLEGFPKGVGERPKRWLASEVAAFFDKVREKKQSIIARDEEIRARLASGERIEKLCVEYELSHSRVLQIKNPEAAKRHKENYKKSKAGKA